MKSCFPRRSDPLWLGKQGLAFPSDPTVARAGREGCGRRRAWTETTRSPLPLQKEEPREHTRVEPVDAQCAVWGPVPQK